MDEKRGQNIIRFLFGAMGACRMTQTELANKTNISRNLLNYFLNGKCFLFEKDLRKVLRAVNAEKIYDLQIKNEELSAQTDVSKNNLSKVIKWSSNNNEDC